MKLQLAAQLAQRKWADTVRLALKVQLRVTNELLVCLI